MFAEIRQPKEQTTTVVNLDKVNYFSMTGNHYFFRFSDDQTLIGEGEVTVFNYDLTDELLEVVAPKKRGRRKKDEVV